MVFPNIGVPLMNGYEVAKALRPEAAFQPLVIVALTAWGNEQSRQKSKAAGFDLYLTKPAHFEELIKIAQ